MAHESDTVEQDLSHIHWSWPEAIAANPARSLATPDLAMDYFAYSPFWDSKSNNNVLRTQRRVENPTYGHAEEKIELTAFRTGFEYVVAHSRPPEVFVIHRRDVLADGSRGQVTAAYFILQDKVYMSPNLHDVIATRLRNAAHLVSNTFSALSAAHPAANPRATNQWRSLPPTAPAQPPDTASTATTVATTAVVAPATHVEGSGSDAPKDADHGTTSAGAAAATPVTLSQPDWHLFHALNTTRSALPDLERLARAPPPAPDPEAEMRALEALAQAAVGRAPPFSLPVPTRVAGSVSSGTPRPIAGRAGSTMPSQHGTSPYTTFAT